MKRRVNKTKREGESRSTRRRFGHHLASNFISQLFFELDHIRDFARIAMLDSVVLRKASFLFNERTCLLIVFGFFRRVVHQTNRNEDNLREKLRG